MRSLSRNPSGRRRTDRPACLIWLLAMAALLMVINEQQPLALADAAKPSISTAIDTERDASSAKTASGERILSRKRRYIVFPQGASLQLVYDTVYPLLDKANLVYIGVTGALAYRLPSDPIHLDEDFANAVENGAFSPFDRVGDGPTGVAAAVAETPSTNETRRPVDTYYNQQQSTPSKPDQYYAQPAQPQKSFKPSFSPSRTDTYELGGPDAPADIKYFRPGQAGRPPPNRYYTNGGRYPGPPEQGVIDKFSNKMDYYFSYADKVLRTIKGLAEKKVNPWKNVQWNVNNFANKNRNYYNRVSEAYAAPPQPPSFATSGSAAPVINRSGGGGGFVPGNRQHAIHPVFGRRKRRTAVSAEAAAAQPRIDDASGADADDETLLEPLTEMDKYHLHLHRTSRHHLYKRIARLIDMKNMNGSECVQRALCETRRQPNDAEPDAFLVEIMRAVFTLPRAVKRTVVATEDDDLHRTYDEAHFGNGDRTGVECGSAYPLCEGSVWSDAFRM